MQTVRTSSRLFLGVLVLSFSALLATPASAAPYAAQVVDAHTGVVLHSRNADAKRYPASLTKIMTLYMLFDALKNQRVSLNTRFSVSAHAAAQAPSKLGLRPGKTVMVTDAIRALVTKSANDVAAVIAENLGGTEAEFARLMTAKARSIGMTSTTFRNASGLPNSEQVTTARDMVTLGKRIMEDFPDYYDFFSLKSFSYAGKRYGNHNKLLYNYEGTDGIKTGYTRASGFNLVASVKRDDKHLIGVVIGGKTGSWRDARMRNILTEAFPKASTEHQLVAQNVPLPSRNPGVQPQQPQTSVLASVAGGISIPRFTPMAQAATVTTEPAAPQQVEEGDTDGATSTFHVQVGAYRHRADAGRQLTRVAAKAEELLRDRQPLTLSFGEKRPLYRARFAGFTESDARETCGALKRMEVDCITMPAEAE